MKNNYPRDPFPAVFGSFLVIEVLVLVLAFRYPFKAVFVFGAIGVLLLAVGALMAYFLSIRKVLKQWSKKE